MVFKHQIANHVNSTNYSCSYSFFQEVNHNLEARKVKTLHRALRTDPLSHTWNDFHANTHIQKHFSLLQVSGTTMSCAEDGQGRYTLIRLSTVYAIDG